MRVPKPLMSLLITTSYIKHVKRVCPHHRKASTMYFTSDRYLHSHHTQKHGSNTLLVSSSVAVQKYFSCPVSGYEFREGHQNSYVPLTQTAVRNNHNNTVVSMSVRSTPLLACPHISGPAVRSTPLVACPHISGPAVRSTPLVACSP